jgi:RNA polymerase sigma-70 factor (ECF subfamily)
MLDNREDAREAFQETFLRAYERLGTLREAGRLRSWLLSIALNFARQRLREAGREAGEAPHGDAGRAGHAPPASEPVERAELSARLRSEIDALPPRQREVVELRMNAELSHAEIGEVLGISEESSRASYYQAVRRLRSRMEEQI